MSQILLFPDPKPLVERLGREFFRALPEGPGVYLMRDAADVLLYVGKAKNLRRRLGSYRVANPDRMPRRHLRLVRAVERIEIQECIDERAALDREAHLLRAHRPRFNRAGTHRGAPRFLAWKMDGSTLYMTIVGEPEPGWNIHGPAGAWARFLRASLVRLLWFALHAERGLAQMPAGWFRGHLGGVAEFPVRDAGAETGRLLELLFAGQIELFAEWVLGEALEKLTPFERAVLDADLEFLRETFA